MSNTQSPSRTRRAWALWRSRRTVEFWRHVHPRPLSQSRGFGIRRQGISSIPSATRCVSRCRWHSLPTRGIWSWGTLGREKMLPLWKSGNLPTTICNCTSRSELGALLRLPPSHEMDNFSPSVPLTGTGTPQQAASTSGDLPNRKTSFHLRGRHGVWKRDVLFRWITARGLAARCHRSVECGRLRCWPRCRRRTVFLGRIHTVVLASIPTYCPKSVARSQLLPPHGLN